MTTQTPKPEAQRTVVTGYLFSVGVQGNKTTFSVKQHEKRQYPDWYVGYFQNPNGNPAPQLTTDAWYKFLCDVVERNGKRYYNLVQATPTTEQEAQAVPAGPAAPTPPPASGRAASPAAGPVAGQREPLPFDDSPFPEEGTHAEPPVAAAPQYVDRDESIWRSVSLQQAIAWAAIPSTEGVPTPASITRIAAMYLHYLRTGAEVADAPQAKE